MVTDSGLSPVEGVEVVFRASRQRYDYLRLRRRSPVERRPSTTSNGEGHFATDWPSAEGFDRFDLLVGVSTFEAGAQKLEVLERADIGRRVDKAIAGGHRVVVQIEAQNVEFLESFRAFLAAVDTPDEEAAYRQAGKPDKVRARVAAGASESDWWYFALGKVYRFRNGKLLVVDEFDPIVDFNDSDDTTEPPT